MPIQSSLLGSEGTGDDATSFLRKIASGRGSAAAAESARNGRKLVSEFAKNGAVAIQLKAVKASAKQK